MMYLGLIKQNRKFQRGQSLVELSLSMVFFLVLLLGALDLGRVYFIYVALEDSAGEGALFLALNPTCETATDCADPNNAEWRAKNSASGFFDWNDAATTTVTVDYPTGGHSVGNTVRVQIDHKFTLLTPMIQNVVGQDFLTLTAIATSTVFSE